MLLTPAEFGWAFLGLDGLGHFKNNLLYFNFNVFVVFLCKLILLLTSYSE